MATREGVSDTGVITAATLIKAGQVAAAALTVAVQASIASNQAKLKRGYIRIAESWREHYETSFIPLENKELGEARNEWAAAKLEKKNHLIGARYAAGVRGALAGAAYKSLKCVSKYNTGFKSKILYETTLRTAELVAMARVMGENRAYLMMLERTDRGFAHLMTALNRGRGLPSDSYAVSQVGANIHRQMEFGYAFDFGPGEAPQRTQAALPPLRLISEPENRPPIELISKPEVIGG